MTKPKFFNVHGPAPSAEQIRKRIWRNLPFQVLLATAPVMLLLSLLLFKPEWTPTFSYWGAVAIAVMGGLYCAAFEADPWMAVRDYQCAELLEVCNKTPEGEKYRIQVLSQARKFVGAELSMLHAWNAGRDVRAACLALYDPAADLPKAVKI